MVKGVHHAFTLRTISLVLLHNCSGKEVLIILLTDWKSETQTVQIVQSWCWKAALCVLMGTVIRSLPFFKMPQTTRAMWLKLWFFSNIVSYRLLWVLFSVLIFQPKALCALIKNSCSILYHQPILYSPLFLLSFCFVFFFLLRDTVSLCFSGFLELPL